MSLVVESRIGQLGNVLKDLTMDDELVKVSGRVNYATLGIYRPKRRLVGDSLMHVKHLYSGKEINIEDKDI